MHDVAHKIVVHLPIVARRHRQTPVLSVNYSVVGLRVGLDRSPKQPAVAAAKDVLAASDRDVAARNDGGQPLDSCVPGEFQIIVQQQEIRRLDGSQQGVAARGQPHVVIQWKISHVAARPRIETVIGDDDSQIGIEPPDAANKLIEGFRTLEVLMIAVTFLSDSLTAISYSVGYHDGARCHRTVHRPRQAEQRFPISSSNDQHWW